MKIGNTYHHLDEILGQDMLIPHNMKYIGTQHAFELRLPITY